MSCVFSDIGRSFAQPVTAEDVMDNIVKLIILI